MTRFRGDLTEAERWRIFLTGVVTLIDKPAVGAPADIGRELAAVAMESDNARSAAMHWALDVFSRLPPDKREQFVALMRVLERE